LATVSRHLFEVRKPKMNEKPHIHPSISDKRRIFSSMHKSGCFVIPNPWDVGSARYLESLGFQALATTSSGFAWSRGCADNSISREMALEHLNALVESVDVPVNADFESGFARTAAGVEESVRLAIETGVAGVSIEDSNGDVTNPLFSIDEAVERMKAARRAIDQSGGDTLLVGRAEGFFVGKPDMEETIFRLRAYSNVGADCLYAPGISTPDQIREIVGACAGKPFNLLVGSTSQLTVADIAALGVRRISVGGAMARTAWGSFMRSAQKLANEGKFDGFSQAASGKELNRIFQVFPEISDRFSV
jgi:2-methylisocitrate lyase-like PEP mutase family enzyme